MHKAKRKRKIEVEVKIWSQKKRRQISCREKSSLISGNQKIINRQKEEFKFYGKSKAISIHEVCELMEDDGNCNLNSHGSMKVKVWGCLGFLELLKFSFRVVIVLGLV